MNKVERLDYLLQLAQADNVENHFNGSEWQQEHARLVNTFLSDHKAMGDIELSALVYGLNSDLQVRDYALGLLKPEQLSAYTHLLNWTPPSKWQSATACLISQIQYEIGDRDEAIKTIAIARPQYPLAKLLRRVYIAGWNPQQFVDMREQLHPQVVAVIFGDGEAA